MNPPNFTAMCPVVAEAIEQMMVEQGDKVLVEEGQPCGTGAPHGIFRTRLRRMKKHGFKDTKHAAKDRKAPTTLLSGYTGILDGLLKAVATNSPVCLDRLRENGFISGRTIAKDYIAANQHLIPPVRYVVAPQGNWGRQYTTGPGEAFQMD